MVITLCIWLSFVYGFLLYCYRFLSVFFKYQNFVDAGMSILHRSAICIFMCQNSRLTAAIAEKASV